MKKNELRWKDKSERELGRKLFLMIISGDDEFIMLATRRSATTT